jgi:hypothetical protein
MQRRPEETRGRSPILSVFELDGKFHVEADFRPVPHVDKVTVAFAQQGILISGGAVERYVPIPTDGNLDLAKVHVVDGIAKISVPTAGLGYRWRAIVMW